MNPSPFAIYARLFAHVLTLAARAIARRPQYLLVVLIAGPALAGVQAVLMTVGARMGSSGGEGAGWLTGIVFSLFQAAAVSLVLFVGRALIEQRRLEATDLQAGVWAFFNDLINVFFVFWGILWLTQLLHLPSIVGLLAFAIFIPPVFETVALSQASGFGIFESAFSFFRRDALVWLIGQLPVVALVIALTTIYQSVTTLLPQGPFVSESIYYTFLALFLLLSFVYRGILFLTLDGYSPRRRAERFGGAPGVR